jgi:hypothetical protein
VSPSDSSVSADQFGWLSLLDPRETRAIEFSSPGEVLDDGDWYVDATSPKRGPVLAMEGERVPEGGVYIRRSRVGEAAWARVTLAAAGRLG